MVGGTPDSIDCAGHQSTQPSKAAEDLLAGATATTGPFDIDKRCEFIDGTPLHLALAKKLLMDRTVFRRIVMSAKSIRLDVSVNKAKSDSIEPDRVEPDGVDPLNEPPGNLTDLNLTDRTDQRHWHARRHHRPINAGLV